MALVSKTSRAIVVAGERYRWVASGGSGQIHVVAQHASGQGAKLAAYLPYYSDFYDPYRPPDAPLFAVTPTVARRLIEAGRVAGWDPVADGPPFRLSNDAAEEAVAKFVIDLH